MDDALVFPKRNLLSKLGKIQTPSEYKNQIIKKSKANLSSSNKLSSIEANQISKPQILFRRNKFLKKNLFPTSTKSHSTRFSIITKVSQIFLSSKNSKNAMQSSLSYDRKESRYNKSCDSKQTINLLKQIGENTAKYFPFQKPEAKICLIKFYPYPKSQAHTSIRIDGRKYKWKKKHIMVSECV